MSEVNSRIFQWVVFRDLLLVGCPEWSRVQLIHLEIFLESTKHTTLSFVKDDQTRAGCSQSSSSTNFVGVVVEGLWRIEQHDQLDLWEIESSGADVSTDQHTILGVLEGVVDLLSISMVDMAMKLEYIQVGQNLLGLHLVIGVLLLHEGVLSSREQVWGLPEHHFHEIGLISSGHEEDSLSVLEFV